MQYGTRKAPEWEEGRVKDEEFNYCTIRMVNLIGGLQVPAPSEGWTGKKEKSLDVSLNTLKWFCKRSCAT